MIRLFIAIDIPEDIREFISHIGGALPGTKPVPRSQIHLTLKFLGDTEPYMENRIVTVLSTVQQKPFPLAIRSVGHFPPRGTPRVIWAGVDPVQHVVKLHNKIEKTLADTGVERDRRKFSPHITLTRLNKIPIARITRFLTEYSMLHTPSFLVSEFHLYSSTLTPKGAIHTKEATFTFNALSNEAPR